MSDTTQHRFTWTVPEDHAALAGHFPGDPLLPASVILDWIGQLSEHTLARRLDEAAVQAKFLRPARPGENLEASLLPRTDGSLRFEVRIGGELAVSGRIDKLA